VWQTAGGEGARGAGSAKWTRELMKTGDLADLRRHASLVAPGDRPELLLYSRSGFDRHLRAEPGVRLIGLRDLFQPELEFERRPRDSNGT
jgi:hypothetical protein